MDEFLDAYEREHFDERAAIMEVDGGLPRGEAERLATASVFGARRQTIATALPAAAMKSDGQIDLFGQGTSNLVTKRTHRIA